MIPHVYQQFIGKVENIIPKNRIYTDPLICLAYGTDASVYRLTPKVVIDVDNEAEVIHVLKYALELRIPITFRAAGTSLSGQAISDSVLVRLSSKWKYYYIPEDAEYIKLQPGITGAYANSLLAPFGKKIGPDPASINSCKIGGILANNASGMCCGVSDNSYKTLISSKLILVDGTVLDTSSKVSKENFAKTHKHLLDALLSLREQILADEKLADRIKRKFKIKNTTGYSINAFVDFDDPFEILQHLMVGSEGTLGFIAEVTYRTVVEHTHKASALLLFWDVKTACEASKALQSMPVAAAELMDRASLRSVEGQPGLPEGLDKLADSVCSLLVETRASSESELQEQIKKIIDRLKDFSLVEDVKFLTNPSEYALLWNIRKGILPCVGGMRESGSSVIIEDIAVPIEHFADAAVDMQNLFAKYQYDVAPLFGHAFDGNLHFVINQNFQTEENIKKYSNFMDELCHIIATKYDGSLKAEHGTGRNIAPFVELEWGKTAYKIMRELKALFDPYNILNPGVILTDNKNSHVENLKPMPTVSDSIDKCMECGFCENVCPSKNLSFTPRQRIAAWREITRTQGTKSSSEINSYKEIFDYFGNQTCATDGLCQLQCPVSIDTGKFIKEQRALGHSRVSESIASFTANHFAGVCKTVGGLLSMAGFAHSVLGTSVMNNGAKLLRKITFNSLPCWNAAMPSGVRGGKLSSVGSKKSSKQVVYVPSCISRNMGHSKQFSDLRAEPDVALSVLLKAGFDVIIPKDIDKLCCGMAFASKGFISQAKEKETELNQALMEASNNGQIPILCETSPCLSHMKQTLDKNLKFYEPIAFTRDFLMNCLEFVALDKTIAIHATCSTQKMGLAEDLKKIAKLCANNVVVPEGITCCGFAGDRGFTHPELTESALSSLKMQVAHCDAGYSTSRTCQIGLTLHGGIPYYSIFKLIDEATVTKK